MIELLCFIDVVVGKEDDLNFMMLSKQVKR